MSTYSTKFKTFLMNERWLLDLKILNGHLAAILLFLISFAYKVISLCLCFRRIKIWIWIKSIR